jgi:DNA transposition AAA+ family ATPase
MVSEEALKVVSNIGYSEDLRERFIRWKDHSGKSVIEIAKRLGRSSAAVSQYINGKYPGDVVEIEKQIAALLSRKEDLELTAGAKRFVETGLSQLFYQPMVYCDFHKVMGVETAPSGSGKSIVAARYVDVNRGTIFISAGVVVKTPRPIMYLIISQVGGVGRYRSSTADYLEALIERLKGSHRMILIDDAHFLTWEAFELLRRLHDAAGIGMVFLGQEKLYQEMRGSDRSGYLYDQLASRVAIWRHNCFHITKADTRKIAESIVPGLDEACVDYLFEVAKGAGRFRRLRNLLTAAVQIATAYDRPIDLPLLQEAGRFLGEKP